MTDDGSTIHASNSTAAGEGGTREFGSFHGDFPTAMGFELFPGGNISCDLLWMCVDDALEAATEEPIC